MNTEIIIASCLSIALHTIPRHSTALYVASLNNDYQFYRHGSQLLTTTPPAVTFHKATQ